MKLLSIGSILFTLCAMSYSVFWAVSYGEKQFPLFIKVLTFTLTAVLGLISVVSLASGGTFPRPLIIGGAASYALLALITFLCGRPITTELILIVLCTTLFLGAFFGASAYLGHVFIILSALDIIVFILSLIFYIIYYRLDKKMAFIVGFIPLGAFGALALIFFIILSCLK